MLAVASLTMFASGPGQSHTFSVFLLPISEDLGISRTSVSSAYAFATLVAAFGLPTSADWSTATACAPCLPRWGPRSGPQPSRSAR